MATTSDVGQTEEFVPASTWEVTKAQFAQFRTNSVSTATGDALYKGYQDRNKAYLDATGSEFPEFEVDNKRVYDFEDTEEYRDAEYVYKQRLKQVRLEDEFILEQRAKDPEKFKGVKTTGEMYDEIREQANMDNAEYANTMLRASGFAQTAGSFIGSAAGAMTDPINIATLPFGAARGAGILKTAFTEAGIAAGTEALIQPGVADWQRQLGNEYGLREML